MPDRTRRRDHRATAVLLFPFVGSFIYWIWRKPTAAEAEAAHLGEAELRRSAAHQPFDRGGWGS